MAYYPAPMTGLGLPARSQLGHLRDDALSQQASLFSLSSDQSQF